MAFHPYNLPSLSALISFEAAARHVSFKAAAQELNVTPAAVSHQIKALETELRQVLFRRNHRGVELTETGAYLLVALQRGFEEISDAVAQLRSDASGAGVTIRASNAVSSQWLAPKLAEFWQSHPHIPVSQNVTDFPDHAPACDLSIEYGLIDDDKGDVRLLFRDRIAALGSPSFAARHRIDTVADFARTPLIHMDMPATGWTHWSDWCRALGYDGPLGGGYRVNNYVIALQAAQGDMGAVLGWGGLTGSLLTSGALVKLWSEDLPSPRDFYIKLHPGATRQAVIVRDWLLKFADRGNPNMAPA
ncbi:Gcv operon activator [Thalassovita gelatinovora]|uniref:Gcv operon activator n=1 Tax=Thalassovita gelatinovora TaxID=53501 RepID=A0A0P1F7I6_THAGE|nr:LysR family transcriptional regulator [Thalassovita gelatinovora]QIZ80151.1 LysR family transcriptional regulator [Thalassovita gelatinovora]CUH63944.1 Gcv operon activator [Thalassovita gelatinovora]SEQ80454.1 DNA-binding transcriptional regulator, LysR family [Thalassovita gelatinovora]